VFLAVIFQDGTGAEVIFVGIQPETTLFASGLSNPVRSTLQTLKEMLVNVL
jgi:hypothetical protein